LQSAYAQRVHFELPDLQVLYTHTPYRQSRYRQGTYSEGTDCQRAYR
jgi:hypothetical protein